MRDLSGFGGLKGLEELEGREGLGLDLVEMLMFG